MDVEANEINGIMDISHQAVGSGIEGPVIFCCYITVIWFSL